MFSLISPEIINLQHINQNPYQDHIHNTHHHHHHHHLWEQIRSAMGEAVVEVVDPAFVQAIEHRPKLTPTLAHDIPTIDLSALTSSAPIESLVSEIGNACKDWGFFQVINHGVPSEIRRKLELGSREFFALTKEEKDKVRKDEVNPIGYSDSELTKNVRDWKEILDFLVKDPAAIPASHEVDEKEVRFLVNRWPEYPHDLRETVEDYAKEMEKLAHKLMELISLSLGLPEDRFRGFFNDVTTTYIRINHYNPCPTPHLVLGLGRHKDSGPLTILAQDDVGGLEVKRKTDGEWVRVKPTPDAYIVNIGDVMQVWSNDEYESVEHRVMVNDEKERFSIPFFLHPDPQVMVEPLAELINEQNPAKYMPYSWGHFYATRKRGNFRKLDVENIQIAHFRIQK